MPAARRPLQLERIATQRRNVEIVFDGKRNDALAAFLFDFAKWRQSVAGIETGLFKKFAARAGCIIFVVVQLAFRNRPGAEIAFFQLGSP